MSRKKKIVIGLLVSFVLLTGGWLYLELSSPCVRTLFTASANALAGETPAEAKARKAAPAPTTFAPTPPASAVPAR